MEESDFNSIIGHSSELKLLEQKINHFESGTFLLSGIMGIGKRTGAWKVIQKVFCEHSTACGLCPQCQQVLRRQHPSTLEIQTDNGMIRLEEGQKILHFVGLRKFSSKSFVIVDEVQLMNMQTANMLLKTFEEPPKGVFFILISSQRARVLRTIQSRSQIIRFKPLNESELKNLVPGASRQEILRSRGSADDLREMQDEEFRLKRDRAVKVLDLFMGDQFIQDSGWRDEWKGREQFDFLIRIWEFELSQRISSEISEGTTNKNEVNSFSARRLNQLHRLFQGLQKMKSELVFHPDQSLFLESFWVRVSRLNDNLQS